MSGPPGGPGGVLDRRIAPHTTACEFVTGVLVDRRVRWDLVDQPLLCALHRTWENLGRPDRFNASILAWLRGRWQAFDVRTLATHLDPLPVAVDLEAVLFVDGHPPGTRLHVTLDAALEHGIVLEMRLTPTGWKVAGIHGRDTSDDPRSD